MHVNKKGTDRLKIVNGKRQWLPELNSIWQEAFGDSKLEVERFYHTFFKEKSCWCMTEGGKPVSVIYGIPALLWLDEEGNRKVALRYLYAGATACKARGNGYYGKLMETLCQANFLNGISILAPLDNLVSFYELKGFFLVQREPDRILTGGSNTRNDIRLGGYVSASQYKAKRDGRLGGTGYVEWGEPFLQYALGETAETGKRDETNYEEGIAAARFLYWNREEHLLFYKKENNILKILETTLTAKQLEEAAGCLQNVFHCDNIVRKGTLLMSSESEWPGRPYFKIPLDE